VHALCNIHALLTNGILRIAEQADAPDEDFIAEFAALVLPVVTCSYLFRERQEHKIFKELLNGVPGLEERLMTGSGDEVGIVAELVSFLISVLLGLIADVV
jgi:hypothetical protein